MRTVGVSPGTYTLQLSGPCIGPGCPIDPNCPPDEIGASASASWGVPQTGWYDVPVDSGDSSPLNPYGTISKLQGLGDVTSGFQMPAWFTLLELASAGLSVYHGYKRHNGSIGWAVGWGFLGTLFPVIVPAIAIAQGFGKPMKKP